MNSTPSRKPKAGERIGLLSECRANVSATNGAALILFTGSSGECSTILSMTRFFWLWNFRRSVFARLWGGRTGGVLWVTMGRRSAGSFGSTVRLPIFERLGIQLSFRGADGGMGKCKFRLWLVVIISKDFEVGSFGVFLKYLRGPFYSLHKSWS